MANGLGIPPQMLGLFIQRLLQDVPGAATLLAQQGLVPPAPAASPMPTPRPGGGGASAALNATAAPQAAPQGGGGAGPTASAFEALQPPNVPQGPMLPPVAPRSGGDVDPTIAALVLQSLQPQQQQPVNLSQLLAQLR